MIFLPSWLKSIPGLTGSPGSSDMLKGPNSRSESSAQQVSGSSSNDYDNILEKLQGYFQGLITNQGEQNEINRNFNSAEAALNREFQSSEARIQRDWNEYMSNTAYQRAMADMKKAGLNPILAYQQGGASSSGTGIAAGSAAAYTATGGDTLSTLLSSAADLINSLTGASASKVNSFYKIFKMFGGK